MEEEVKDFDTVDKVYLVWHDNGEQYEDSFSYVCHAFKSKESAVRCLEEGYELERGNDRQIWREKPYVCSMGNMDCDECPKGGNGSSKWDWDCEELEPRQESEWDNTFWYIEEMDLWE